MITRTNRHARSVAVLVPKIMVQNPFLYEQYLRVSKHHKNLSIINNEKLLDPRSYNLIDVGMRVGNAEQYMKAVDVKRLVEMSISASKQLRGDPADP